MALSNGGIARRIYENADAALQLQVRSKECARKAIHRVLAAKSQIFWDEMLGLSLPVTLAKGGRQFWGIWGFVLSMLSMTESFQISHTQTNWETHTFLYCKKRKCPGEVDNFWVCTAKEKSF